MLVEKNNNTPINDCKMQISAYSMQGRRCHMEDYFDISYMMKPVQLQKPNEWPYEYFYMGVFDGHGGHHAAHFAKNNLLRSITKQWKFWSNNDDDVLSAIKTGFAETHAAMLKVMPSWTRTNRVLPSTAGTTASILFIRNGKFYTGHVGDSRIVISNEHPETKNWRHEELTQDHKPENEKERIENAGGEVKTKIGVHRVVWKRPVLCKELEEKLIENSKHPWCDFGSVASYPIDEALIDSYQRIPFLAIARSLGDFWSFNPDNGEYVVSPEPDVMCRSITERDKCILLATDGLWNVMNSSQAIRFLQELKIVKKGERNSKLYSGTYFATDNFYHVSMADDDQNHALSLVYMAYQIWERRSLRSDNITAIVAMISDILTPQQTASINQTNGDDVRAYTEEYIKSNAFYLGHAPIVCEDISLNKKPKFKFRPGDDFEFGMLSSLQDYLLFPPSIIDTKSYRSYVKPPQNYFRLSNAKCRRLQRDDIDANPDEYIYIKEVSDDPGDLIKCPTRKNSKNVEIRDSSAQATQSMHDFGQPWDQLVDNDVARDSKEKDDASQGSQIKPVELLVEDRKRSLNYEGDNVEKKDTDDRDELDDLIGKEESSIVDDDESNGLSDREEDNLTEERVSALVDPFKFSSKRPNEDDNDNDLGIDEDDGVSEELNSILDGFNCSLFKAKSCSNNEDSDDLDDQPTCHTIDQVLSVVSENRTPITRRSTRRSATENPKRKLEIEITTSPKAKRRKSHPIHTVTTVTKG